MLTVWTQVDGIAVGGLTTAQHLLHHFVDGFILRMGPFEVRPPIDKDVLEAVLLLATIWCHLPECRPPSSGCQSAAGVTGRKKEIPQASSLSIILASLWYCPFGPASAQKTTTNGQATS